MLLKNQLSFDKKNLNLLFYHLPTKLLHRSCPLLVMKPAYCKIKCQPADEKLFVLLLLNVITCCFITYEYLRVFYCMLVKPSYPWL